MLSVGGGWGPGWGGRGGGAIPVAAVTGRSLAESVLSKGPELRCKSGRAVLGPYTKFAIGFAGNCSVRQNLTGCLPKINRVQLSGFNKEASGLRTAAKGYSRTDLNRQFSHDTAEQHQ